MTVITIQLPGSPGSPGPKGDPGPLSVMTIDPNVVTGAPGTSASATITGVAPNQIMHLTLPRGDKGDKGDNGISPTIASGTINTGAPGTNVVATLTGTFPNYLLNLTIPRGQTGNPGPSNTISIGTVIASEDSEGAAATLTGTSPNQVLNLVMPRGLQGDTGATGLKGDKGDKGDQGLPGIPGSAGGAGQGVPQGGLTGAVLSKLGPEDFNHGWVNSASQGTPNTVMKRDANGRAVVADPSALNEIATKQSSEAAADARVAAHDALAAHGATGAVVGTTNAQTLTNKTLTTPKITTGLDLTSNAAPGNPAVGDYRFNIGTTGIPAFRNSTGVTRNLSVRWPDTATTFSSAALPGDIQYHTVFQCMCVLDKVSAAWRQAQVVTLTEADFTTYKAALVSAGFNPHNGFQVFAGDTNRLYTATGGTGWQYTGGGTDPAAWVVPTLTGSWSNYDTLYEGARYKKLANGTVFIEGLIKTGTLGQACFTLPVGSRPAKKLIFPTVSDTATITSRVDISPAGAVVPYSGDSGYFSITCSFLASQ